jgi:hypothetical protein
VGGQDEGVAGGVQRGRRPDLTDAELGPHVGDFAWHSWSAQWEATSGEHVLCVRATDEAGNVQPSEQPWNYQGMGNNMLHRVEVLVE